MLDHFYKQGGSLLTHSVSKIVICPYRSSECSSTRSRHTANSTAMTIGPRNNPIRPKNEYGVSSRFVASPSEHPAFQQLIDQFV